MYYFIRVNGYSAHTNRRMRDYWVCGEPTDGPDSYFNGLGYCLENDIVRIGWAETS
jgi:hypothetical protein